MKARFIYENLNFRKGLDPKNSLAIGEKYIINKYADKHIDLVHDDSKNLVHELVKLAKEDNLFVVSHGYKKNSGIFFKKNSTLEISEFIESLSLEEVDGAIILEDSRKGYSYITLYKEEQNPEIKFIKYYDSFHGYSYITNERGLIMLHNEIPELLDNDIT